jgi:hypothetical protein
MSDAVTRAEDDLRRGDYALARQRLESYLSTKGYDPELLARIGQISFDMHDLFNAGRHWLLSTAAGEVVDRAIAEFMRRTNHDPKQAAEQLHRSARLPDVAAYPPIVQSRLHDLKMAAAIVRACRENKPAESPLTWRGRLVILFIIAVTATAIIFCCVGLIASVRWLFGN